MIKYSAPIEITSGSCVNIVIRSLAKRTAIKEIEIDTIAPIFKVASKPALTRCGLLAPRFCPTKVESAAAKFMAGIAARESIRMAIE